MSGEPPPGLANQPPCYVAPTGTEPRGLYNVVLFLLHAKPCAAGGGHRVALEEAMKITYLRVGKVGAVLHAVPEGGLTAHRVGT